MEKNRSTKVIAIVALLIGVVGLSVGFAAFSNTLNIQSSLNVKPDKNTFNVDFSTSSTEVSTKLTVEPKNSDVTATSGTINNDSDPTISGLGATFTEPGQSVTYEFYAYNAGEYNAFLKSIEFKNASDVQTYKKCTANKGTTEAYVNTACGDITLNVTVGEGESAAVANAASKNTITGHQLDRKHGEKVTVTITYENKGDTQQRADGDFSVEFGNVELEYSSVD